MSIFRNKKKEEPAKQEPKLIPVIIETTEDLKAELNELKLQGLMKKVAEQEILIRRLLDLVVMNIEHKAYDKYLLPRIHAIKNMLDKK